MTSSRIAPPRRVCLVSLGCPKNLVDSETMLGSLSGKKFQPTVRMEEADVVIVNTCGFLRAARREGREAIRRGVEWRRRSGGILVVAGCLVQYHGVEAGKLFPEADILLGVGEGGSLGRILGSRLPDADPRISLRPVPRFPFHRNLPRLVSTPRHWAYLRIADGCDNRCAYCLIPVLRGPRRERPLPAVVKEAERLVERGAREVVLIAQDTAAYGRSRPGRNGLERLLESLQEIAGLEWIRILYAHPRHVGSGLLAAVSSLDKVCPYLDLPIQHIDDGILERMGRKVDSRRIEGVIDRARELVPGISLRTTLMVGFPGEGEAEFARLAEFVRRKKFDHLGVFAYSREKGTPAFGLGPGVPGPVARRRREILMEIQREVSAERLRSRRGETLEVLIDGPFPEPASPLMVGRAIFSAPEIDGLVVVEGEGIEAGEMVRVRITDSSEYDLYGVRTGGPVDRIPRISPRGHPFPG